LLPLGLAYGKAGSAMPLFHKLLDEALAADDVQLAARCVAAMGPVGFYFPEPMLEVIRPVAERPADAGVERALLTCLSTVRTIHFDAVDLFLYQVRASESLRRRIDAASDEELVR